MNMRDKHYTVPVPDYVPPASIKDNNGSIYGWICPICGQVVSPYTDYCNCRGKVSYTYTYTYNPTYTTTSTSDTNQHTNNCNCNSTTTLR